MRFSQKKLPRTHAEKMRLCPIGTVKPFALMMGPAYVYLKRNEKFVAVKGPLDFFEPQELEKLRSYESFFFTEFIDQVLPFRESAVTTKILIAPNPTQVFKKAGPILDIALSPTPYEISDAVLRVIGPLWGKNGELESFFVCAFVNELCPLLPSDLLKNFKEHDVVGLEKAIVVSSWMVFLALHLGHCSIEFLNELRLSVLKYDLHEQESLDGSLDADLLSLHEWCLDRVNTTGFEALALIEVGTIRNRVFQKISARLDRVFNKMSEKLIESPSIFGEKGFTIAVAE